MADVQVIKNRELLQIYTRLPLADQPKESKVFLVLGNEWSFHLAFDSYEYAAYLQLKNKKIEFHPFEIDFEVGFKYDAESFNSGTTKITNEFGGDLICSFNECDLEIPFDYYDTDNILLFQLRFQFQIEPMLNVISKLEDKAVQTSPYMDASVLLESTGNDFQKLFQGGFGHDVQLRCGDQTIQAHKLFLCCRSTFFMSKFKNEDEDTYEVKMDTSIFEPFLRYLYTGVMPELTSENAIRMYKAASDYSVEALGKLCADFLCDNLSRDNAVEILKIADRHKHSELKKSVMEYMTEEKTSLMGDKWTDFCKENPVLANEVLNLYVHSTQEIQEPRAKKPRLY